MPDLHESTQITIKTGGPYEKVNVNNTESNADTGFDNPGFGKF